MEVVNEIVFGFGVGFHTLQRQTLAHLQFVLQESRQARPSARWAAGPFRNSSGMAVGSAARQPQQQQKQRHGLIILNEHRGASTPWACKPRSTLSAGCAGDVPNNTSPVCLASLSVDGGSVLVGAGALAGGGNSAAAQPERHSCCSSAVRGSQNPTKQQQEAAASALWYAEGRTQQQQGPDGESSGRIQLRNMSGTWIRDGSRSDSMEDAMNLMRLNGIVRQAVKLVRGVRIDLDPDYFTFTVFSVISWFKVKEVYPLSGEERSYRRRDMRRGGAQGHVEPYGPGVRVQLRWDNPYGGRGRDHFRLVSEDELHIESVIEVGDRTARYLTIYNRKPDRRHRPGPSGHGDHPHRLNYPASASTDPGDDGAGSDPGVQRSGGCGGGGVGGGGKQ